MKALIRILPLVIAVLVVLSPGCARVDPLDRPIPAASADAFSTWRARLGSDVSPAVWQDLDIAIQELKIKVMAERGESSKGVLDEGMRAMIHGRTLREALVLGFDARRARLDRERAEVQARIDHDSRLTVRADDTASQSYLASVNRADADRLEMLKRETDLAASKITGWGATPKELPAPSIGPVLEASGLPIAAQDTR